MDGSGRGVAAVRATDRGGKMGCDEVAGCDDRDDADESEGVDPRASNDPPRLYRRGPVEADATASSDSSSSSGRGRCSNARPTPASRGRPYFERAAEEVNLVAS